MDLPKYVKMVEVGPRDGLQNETKTVSIDTKITLINKLAAAGLSYIEVGSFVSEEKVPQMANTEKIIQSLEKHNNVQYAVLVPNSLGMEKAIHYQCDEVSIFAGASETFSQKNINCSIAESFARFQPVIDLAKKHSIKVRGYLSCCFGCPYEGEVPLSQVVTYAKQLFDLGCYEISLGDTIGVATPGKVTELITTLQQQIPSEAIAVHFHDTYGQALANIYASLQLGVSIIDSSVAGLGGCPYAKGATGNVASEDVLYLLNGLGIDTQVDLSKLIAAGNYISKQLQQSSQSKVAKAFSGSC